MAKIPTMIFVLLIAVAGLSKAQPQFREFKAPRKISQISMSSKPIIEFDEKMTSAQKEIAKKIVEDDFMEFSAKGTSYVENHREEIESKIRNDLETNFQQRSFWKPFFGCPNPHWHILWVCCPWRLIIFFSCHC